MNEHMGRMQEIKMEEEDDEDDHQFELFHSRYQNSYLVVDKSMPQEDFKIEQEEESEEMEVDVVENTKVINTFRKEARNNPEVEE